MTKRKGILWNTLGSAMYGANSFLMLALVSRVGTVEDAGYFGIAHTTAQLLYIVGLLGVNHYQMTDYSEKHPFSSYAKTRLFSCFLMLVCCAGTIAALKFTGLKRSYTILLTVLMLLNATGELYQALFFQKNRLDLSGSALFFRTLWPLAVFTAVILLRGSIAAALLAQIVCNLLITLYYALRVAPPFIRKNTACAEAAAFPAALLWECLPLAVSLFLMNIVINMSKYGIEFRLDDTAQGYYGMIFMPAQVINLCSQFLFKPYLNQYAVLLEKKQTAAFLRLLGKQLLFILGLIAACCAGAWVLGTQVLGFLYGKDLSALRLSLTLVVLGGGIFAMCQLFYYILVILRRQKGIVLLYISAFVLSIPLSLFMISAWGILGAVLAFAATHLLILLGYLVQLRKALL